MSIKITIKITENDKKPGKPWFLSKYQSVFYIAEYFMISFQNYHTVRIFCSFACATNIHLSKYWMIPRIAELNNFIKLNHFSNIFMNIIHPIFIDAIVPIIITLSRCKLPFNIHYALHSFICMKLVITFAFIHAYNPKTHIGFVKYTLVIKRNKPRPAFYLI